VVEGSTIKLEPIFTPATATNKNVTWKSSSPEVAAIAADGTVTGVAKGETTITVTTADGSFTATCMVTVTDKPKDYIEVNGIKMAIGNLVADGKGGAMIGAPEDYGLYFQFGSLIGWSGGANGDGTGVTPTNLPLTTKVIPANYTVTTWNKNWMGDPTTESEVNGTGDPCKYYLKGTWRLPTKDEYEELFKDKGYPFAGPWTWNTTQKSIEHKDGMKFPASGCRNNRVGNLDIIGSDGFYWSASPSSSSNGYDLYFSKSNATPNFTNIRAYGFSVRCVKDEIN